LGLGRTYLSFKKKKEDLSVRKPYQLKHNGYKILARVSLLKQMLKVPLVYKIIIDKLVFLSYDSIAYML